MKCYLKLRLKFLYCDIIIDIEFFSLALIPGGLRVQRNHELILVVPPMPALPCNYVVSQGPGSRC